MYIYLYQHEHEHTIFVNIKRIIRNMFEKKIGIIFENQIGLEIRNFKKYSYNSDSNPKNFD